jgi:hypothetical protein
VLGLRVISRHWNHCLLPSCTPITILTPEYLASGLLTRKLLIAALTRLVQWPCLSITDYSHQGSSFISSQTHGQTYGSIFRAEFLGYKRQPISSIIFCSSSQKHCALSFFLLQPAEPVYSFLLYQNKSASNSILQLFSFHSLIRYHILSSAGSANKHSKNEVLFGFSYCYPFGYCLPCYRTRNCERY